MNRILKKALITALDNSIDEIARLQKENKEMKERAINACELVYSLTKQVSSLESELAAAKTRDFNRSKRIKQSTANKPDS